MLQAFLSAPSGVLGLLVLSAVLLVSILAPGLVGDYVSVFDVTRANEGPSPSHLLGTDGLGRDILARVVVGTRLSIGVAFAATGFGVLIGIVVGSLVAITGPRLRTILLRTNDALWTFPTILICIFVAAVTGPGTVAALVGVGLHLSFSFVRITSALAMSIGNREYIAAARVLGIKGPRLMLRYLLPSMAETLVITATVAISTSILTVTSLSFLGLGVQPPEFDWGRMLTEGVRAFYVTPAAALGPAVAIAVSALAFGLVGEAAARAMNPVLWVPVEPPAERARRVATPSEPAKPGTSWVTTIPTPVEAEAAAGPSVLEVRDLEGTFPGPSGPVAVVDHVSFSLRTAEMLGIVGESGSGKTMTAMAIAQIVPFPGSVKGKVKLKGKALEAMKPKERARLLGTELALVFQDPTSSLNPALTIGTQLTEGVEEHRGLSSRQARSLAVARINEVNIPTPELQLGRRPHELSGGMRQRVTIAMGLMNEPSLLIADEPTTALDVTIQAQIMELIQRINREHHTAVMLISHNIALVSQNCSRLLVMYAGRVIEDLTSKELTSGPLHPYTRALLAAVPTMSHPRGTPLEYIPGQSPGFAEVPPGCPYHPRCPLAIEKCGVERPPLQLRPDRRSVACWVANRDLA